MQNKNTSKADSQQQNQDDQGQDQQNAGNGITGSNTVKDPNDWTTGSEPMTGAQASYLKTLSDEAGEPFDENLSKAEASIKINELQHKTGRGLDSQNQTQ